MKPIDQSALADVIGGGATCNGISIALGDFVWCFGHASSGN